VSGLTTATAEIKSSLAETRETLRIVDEWTIGWAKNHLYGDVVQSSARPNLNYGPGWVQWAGTINSMSQGCLSWVGVSRTMLQG